MTTSSQSSDNVDEPRRGKENQNQDQVEEKYCFECKRSLAISPQLINVAGRAHNWHPECFRCNVCQEPMDKNVSCHIYKDKILCRDDYARLQRDNSIKCARCRWPIGASDWVRKAGNYVYHLTCFNCDICLRQLNTGEQFAINVRAGFVHLVCRLHFSIANQNQPASHGSGLADVNAVSTNSSFNNNNNQTPADCSSMSSPNQLDFSPSYAPRQSAIFNSNKQNQRQQHAPSRQSRQQYLHLLASPAPTSGEPNEQSITAEGRQLIEAQLDQQHASAPAAVDDLVSSISLQQQQQPRTNAPGTPSNSSSSSQMVGTGGLPTKSKRVRTTFTEDQLSILQNHFHIDSNPDGQDLERIATITGLSKRVTQVWFQNSRARQKKYMIKRKPSSGGANMIASVAVSMSLSVTASQMHQSRLQQQQQQQQQQSLFDPSIQRQMAPVNDGNESEGFQSQVGDNQMKWSNMSDRSDLSFDETTTGGRADDTEDTQSSEGQLVVSEESNDDEDKD